MEQETQKNEFSYRMDNIYNHYKNHVNKITYYEDKIISFGDESSIKPFYASLFQLFSAIGIEQNLPIRIRKVLDKKFKEIDEKINIWLNKRKSFVQEGLEHEMDMLPFPKYIVDDLIKIKRYLYRNIEPFDYKLKEIIQKEELER